MRFTFTEEQEAFRQRVCQFLTKEMAPSAVASHRDAREGNGYTEEFTQTFRKNLGANGFIGVGWPEEYGGQGKDMLFEAILSDEMEYHSAPSIGRAISYIPAAILAYGSEEQKAHFLPRIVAGEIDFFLGYSEPEAGSDLASLTTRAVADGDDFVITGQKAFSSDAHHADYGWVVARTDLDVPKHKGMSLFIVDMRSSGISLGGFNTISGWHHPTVAFEEVRVPRSSVVGEVNMGWYYIMGAIDYERAVIGTPGMLLRTFDRLVEYCKTTYRHGKPVIQSPVERRRLAELYAEVEASRLMSYWVASMHARGLQPQHEAGLAFLVKRETVREIDNLAVDILGPTAQLRRGDALAPADGGFEHDYLDRLFFHFAAGGFDISRNVIASRGLGLPRS